MLDDKIRAYTELVEHSCLICCQYHNGYRTDQFWILPQEYPNPFGERIFTVFYCDFNTVYVLILSWSTLCRRFATQYFRNCQKWLSSLQPLRLQKQSKSKTIIWSSVQFCTTSKVLPTILKKLTARIEHCFFYKLFMIRRND